MGLADSELRNAPTPVATSPDASVVWSEVLGNLRLRVSREGFDTWLSPTRGRAFRDNTIEVDVPNAFSADWIGQHYSAEIAAALAAVTGQECGVSFRPRDSAQSTVVVGRRTAPARRPQVRTEGYRLQERYTFDTFVVGESNRLAAAAARSVAERPGASYNPLFIYGGVGLGKTHLVQAVGNQALVLRPQMKVHYCAAETLFIELIQAIEKNTRLEFKNKYRGLDLLLLDDIHYLIGKERLQEEVFYIFNSLHDSGSQIVFTSDRPPQELPTLESRLVSRLGSGLVVDIQQPDVETRVAILKQKAGADHFDLPDEVAYYIAARVRSSIRELEGSLIRLQALTSLAGQPLSLDVAQEALKDLVRVEEPVDHTRILAASAEAFGVAVPDITGDRRTKQLALARQVAMYLMRTKLSLSLKEIGHHFGGKDHTTVMHAVKKVEELRAKDITFDARVDRLLKGISRGEAR
jgi:chromosomal replication initiator protein